MLSTIAAWLARLLGALGFVLTLSIGYEQGMTVPVLLERAMWAMLGCGAVGLFVGTLMGSLMHTEQDETTTPQTDERLPASLPPLPD